MKINGELQWTVRDETPGCPLFGETWPLSAKVRSGLVFNQASVVCAECGAEPHRLGDPLFIPEPQEG